MSVFEPEAASACVAIGSRSTACLEQIISASVAISLKRIADTLDGTAAGLCVTETILGGKRS